MRNALLGFGVLVVLAGRPAATGEPRATYLKLPPGTTPLAEIGVYRIGYQLYGKDPVDMPPSWSGYFTDDIGIAFTPVSHAGRGALLLHCPWRMGTGAVFVEYRLGLPKGQPVKLSFGIAMRADIVEKSDGATFTVSVTSGGKTSRLMSEHYTQSEPKEFEFDLGRYAGKRIELRIQTEPGPNRSASFDFSRFVDPKLTVGAAGDSRAGVVADMTGTKAYRVLREADLTKLANRSGRGIVPSCKVARRNSVRRSGDGYELRYEGEDCEVVYSYSPKTGSLDDVTVRVDSGGPIRPCAGGGVFVELDGKTLPPERSKLLSHRLEGGAVVAKWRYEAGGRAATVDWRFEIVGKALVIEATSPDKTISKFSLGRTVADFKKRIPIPYLYYEPADYLPAQRVFAMGYIDWTESHASRSPGRESVYTKKLDGERNALREVGYVAVSPDLGEVLPNIPHPPSPYLKLLGPKMMLDSWRGNFGASARLLEKYKSFGIDELAIIEHVWQRYGYDIKLPDHLPARPEQGGDEGMKVLAGTAKRLGYVFSLHENYIDFYPDAPSWNEKDIVRTPRGEFSKAWYHKGTKVQSFAMKANRMLHYAGQNSPEIHRRFGTTAAYLDVHTCVPPWHHVDYEAGQDRAGMHAAKVDYHARLFRFEREVHRGPLFGEGSRHFFWAGLFDGAEAQVTGGEDHAVLVDFDLLKLHPQMVNHGMGYYSRWLRKGRQAKHGVDWPTPLQLDKYRAQEIAYGHAAFVGSGVLDIMPAVIREYHLVQPVQALYGDAKVTEISYEVEGRFVSSSVAAVAGVLDRLRVRYDSDLTLHVNLGRDDWGVVTIGKAGYILPSFGFVAEGPDTLVYTARRDGVIVDFARTETSLYVDSRTEVYEPWGYGRKEIEPRVKDFGYLGGDRFRITYEWRIDEALNDDLHCFVHFCRQGDEGEIVFQNDHAPPRPTSEWRPGTVLADGPYTVSIPEEPALDGFDVMIGLYKDGRAKLAGVPAGSNRIIIGRLAVRREGGRVTGVELLGMDDMRREFEGRRKAFSDRMNTAGRKIDFGQARTDGSFKVLVKEDHLELLPFPREEGFGIELDLRRLVLGPYRRVVRVLGLGAGGEEIGEAPSRLVGGRLTFAAGMRGAVRYLIRY